MTHIRRTAAVGLGIVFFVALFASLAFVRLNVTLMDPHYYPGRMKTDDVYRFVMVDILTSALDEARQIDAGQFGGDFDPPRRALATSGLTTRQMVVAVHRALSPRDLEKLTAPAVLQISEFVTGERDSVVVKIDLGRHVRGAADELHRLMLDSDAYAAFVEHALEPRIREATEEALGANENVSGWMLYLFGSAEDTEDRMVRVVMRTLTARRGGLAVQVEHALDEFTAYLVGETDSFEIRVQLTDTQVATAVEETKSILRDADAYELVYPGVVEPVLVSVMGPRVELPYGAGITRDEVMGALRQAAPPSWVQLQSENLIDHVGPYVVGRSDGFSTDISLSRNKREAADVLAEIAVANVLEALSNLPFCGTETESTAARRILRQTLPDCIPSGVSAGEVLDRAESSIARSIQDYVLASIPDTITFTESLFRSALERSGGPETLERLDYVRGVLNSGWAYSHHDLRADLSERSDALQALDGARSFFKDGYSHTYQGSSGRRPNDSFGADLDGVRTRLETVGRYEWPAHLLTLTLLIAIGLLGGTSWRGRIVWMSSAVVVSAGLAFMLSWPVQEPLANVAAEQARAEVGVRADGIFGVTVQLVVAKVGEVAGGVAEDIVEGVRLYGLVLAGAAGIVLLMAVFWRRAVEVVGGLLRRLNLSPGGGVR